MSLLKGKPHAPGRAWDPKAKARRDESEERRKAGAEKAARRRESKHYAVGTVISGEVDLYTLQRLMTHKSPMVTQRYAHLRDETLKRGANVMSRIVAAAGPVV